MKILSPGLQLGLCSLALFLSSCSPVHSRRAVAHPNPSPVKIEQTPTDTPREHVAIKPPQVTHDQPAPRVQQPFNKVVNSGRKISSFNYRSYTIRPGDTLSNIAKRAGSTVESLRSLNNIHGNDITAGNKIYLPHATYDTRRPDTSIELPYIVRKGDTLSEIASRYGDSLSAIKSRNKLRNNAIYPGQKLNLKRQKVSVVSTAPGKNPVPSTTPRIVRRKSWTKAIIKGNSTPLTSIKKITVHHTSEAKAISRMTDLAFLRSMDNSHKQRGWACIGYHFIIGRDGTIYEGRPLKYQGAHASGHNKDNLGISLIGDFQHSLPKTKQLASLQNLLVYLMQQKKISSSQVRGHGELGKTSCPGKRLLNWIRNFRGKYK